MDDLHRKQEQLNISSDAEFTVEDIMAEFGSAVQTEEELRLAEEARLQAAQAAGRAASRHDRTLTKEERMAVAEAVRKAEEEKLATEEADTVKIWTPKSPQEELPEETAEEEEIFEEEHPEEELPQEDETPFMMRSLQLLPRLKKREKEPEEVRSPEEAAGQYAARTRHLRLFVILAWLLMALSVAVTAVVSTARWGLKNLIPIEFADLAVLAILLAHIGLSFDVLRQGIAAVGKGKFTAKTLVALTAAVTLVQSAVTVTDGRLSLASVASLLLTVTLWSDYLLAAAKWRAVKTLLAMDEPVAVTRTDKAWEEKNCLHRAKAEAVKDTADLEATPRTETVVGIVSAVLAALALAVAVVLFVKGGRDLLLTFNILLLGICPLGAILAYARGLHLALRRLKNAGAVVWGWGGAGRLAKASAAVVTDADLFPRANVAMNGIKIFTDQTTERVLGYALAMVERGGAKVLTQLFSETLELQNGRRFRVDNFHAYETGGFYGEIQGDTVRLGSVGFMKSMGIEVPADVRKRNALHLAVDGVITATFVLSYTPWESGRRGLAMLMNCRGLTPVLATRDMQLTPLMVQAAYRLPAERMEYPACHQREELASLQEADAPGGYLTRGGFLPFVMVVRAARQLRHAVHTASGAALLGAVLGLLLMALLTLIGAFDTASAANLLLYHAVWLIPAGLMTGSVGK